MNTVGPIWGCPVVAYGPGDSDLDHTPGENIVIPEYERSIEILTGVLQALVAGK
jgi:LysW-gamma-L-lysine carboxypeptidase